jgi:hypothetical protein
METCRVLSILRSPFEPKLVATTGRTRPRIIPDQLCMENQVAMERAWMGSPKTYQNSMERYIW